MLKKFIYVLILFLISVSGICQNNYSDSLLNLLKKTGEDTNRVNLLNKISGEFKNQSDFTKAKAYALQSLNLCEKLVFEKGKATTYKVLGNIYYGLGEFPKAIEFYFSSLKIREREKDSIGVAALFTNIGNTYNDQSDYIKALEYFNKAILIYEKVKMQKTFQYFNVLNGLGNAYKNAKDIDTALEYYLRSKEISEQTNDEEGLGIALNNIGSIYQDNKKQYDVALDYYFKALKIREKIEDLNGETSTLFNIGLAYHYQKKNKEALVYGLKSLAIARDLESLDFAQYAEALLSDAYEKLGDYTNAYKYHVAFIKDRDSLFSAEKIKNIANQESQMKEEKMEASFNEEKLKKDAELKQQKIISLSFTFGFALVLVLIFVVFRSLKQSKEKNKIIESQKIEVEFKNALVEHKNKEIIDSITYAKRLQEAILPTLKLVQEYLTQSFILYKPKDIVAGDFYWMETKNETVWIAAADCTGHGVPGAMVSVVCSNALNQSFKEFELREPGRILDKTRDLVFETFSKSDKDVKDGMDISLCSINTKTKEIKWAGANNPLWYIQNGELKEITANKQPIGKTDNPKPFTTHTFQLNTNDSLYLFTDGYADQFGGPKGKKLKYKQMGENILSGSNKSLLEQKEILEQAFDNWKGELEQVDDVCMIGIKL